EFIRDTSYTIDGDWIIFEGEVEEPVLATLGVQGNPALIIPIENGEQGGIIPGPSLQFFLSNTTIKIEGDANTIYKAKVSGGKANNEWADIKPEVGELTEENWTTLKEA